MTTFETWSIILQIPMPIVVSIGIYQMVRANKDRAKVGERTENALQISIDALQEAVTGLKQSNHALAKVLEKIN